MPRIISYQYNKMSNNDFRFTLQYITGAIILCSSLFLVINNAKDVKKSIGKEKVLKTIFLLLGCIVFLTFSVALYYQFRLRNGIGF